MFKKYILAVSGGPDSMAMLDMYKKKAKAVCTVNYHKRKDSNNDVNIVKEYCNKHNIKLFIYDVNKQIYKENKNENFQSLAREIRYNFFLKIAKQENIKNLMIAHNLNDSLETAYMQFKKHSKSLFYGIKEKTKYKDLNIYRPLLCYQKKCLERYCLSKQISFAIDSSNELDIYERNKVRKIINNWSQQKLIEFIKKIKKYNKDHKKLNKEITKKFIEWKKLNFNINFLNLLDKEIVYYLIYEWLKLNGEKNNNENKINHIIEFIKVANNSKKYRLEKNKYLIKQKNELKII